VLYQLIESSKDVLDHLRSLSKEIKLLSMVILNDPEDLKLVAGIIIRTMILGGMEYADFWSNGTPFSVPFPTNETQVWIHDFQDFMDELSQLKFLQDDGDAGVLYALSMTARDSLQLVQETGSIVLFFEHRNLTAFVLGAAGRITEVIDVPISHITATDVKIATIRNSDDTASEITAAQLTLQFHPLPWTYLYNADERNAKKMTMILENMADAQEAVNLIEEIQRSKVKRKISSSQILDISQTSPPQATSDVEKATTNQPDEEEVTVIIESYPLAYPQISVAENAGVAQEESLKSYSDEPAINGRGEPNYSPKTGEPLGSDGSHHGDDGGIHEKLTGDNSSLEKPKDKEEPNPAPPVQSTTFQSTKHSELAPADMPSKLGPTGKLKRPALASTEEGVHEPISNVDVFDVPDTPPRPPKAGSKKPITYGHRMSSVGPSKSKPSKVPLKAVATKKISQMRAPKSKPPSKKKPVAASKAVKNSKTGASETPGALWNKPKAEENKEDVGLLATSKTSGKRVQDEFEIPESPEPALPATKVLKPGRPGKATNAENSELVLLRDANARHEKGENEKSTPRKVTDKKLKEQLEEATGSKSLVTKSKPSGVPQPTKQANALDDDDDVDADVPAKPHKLKRPMRQSVAKDINYDEDEDSNIEQDESEYVQQDPTQGSVEDVPRVAKKRKVEATATTFAGPGKKSKSNSQAPPSTAGSAKKKTLVGQLLEKSLPTTANRAIEDLNKSTVSASRDTVAPRARNSAIDTEPPVRFHPGVQQAPFTSSSPILPTTAAPEKPDPHSRGTKRPVATAPAETPKVKRRKSPGPLQQSDVDEVHQSGRSRTQSSEYVYIEEIGSPYTSDVNRQSEKNMLNTLVKSTTADDDLDAAAANGLDYLTHSKEVAMKRKDQIRRGPGDSDAIPSHILSSNSKPIPASPHAESRAISGHADECEIKAAGAKAEIAKAASDPFKERPKNDPKRRNTKFMRRLTGPDPDETPVPPPCKKPNPRKPLMEPHVLPVQRKLNDLAVPALKNRPEIEIAQQVVKVAQKQITTSQAPPIPAETVEDVSTYHPLAELRVERDVQIAQQVVKVAQKPEMMAKHPKTSIKAEAAVSSHHDPRMKRDVQIAGMAVLKDVPKLKEAPTLKVAPKLKEVPKLRTTAHPPTTPTPALKTEEKADPYHPPAQPRKKLDVQIVGKSQVAPIVVPSSPIPSSSLPPSPTEQVAESVHEADEQESEPTYEADDVSEIDPDQTLVEPEDSPFLPTKALKHIPSSPPPMQGPTCSPSLHSSSSLIEAEQETLVAEERAEEAEWEAALKPEQRAVSDVLIRMSKYFIHHLVDEEAALQGIVEEFERDGRDVVNGFVQRYTGDCEGMMGKVEGRARSQIGELRKLREMLRGGRVE
jgi:hypothetical protein